jgi:glycosyltransferase involved in cell wall biosynthesis
MPFFTVIIPLYNKDQYIENTLKSILNQTFTDYEILIINDCSTDNSVKKVNSFLSTNIKLIEHSKNKGLSAARNTGIHNASAEYITFLDADDVWKTHFLETIHKLIIDFPEAGIFATNYEEIYNSKAIIPHNHAENFEKNSSLIIDFFKYNLGQGIYNHGSVCFHKRVFKTVGFYDEIIDFSEDIVFNIRANAAFKLAFCNTIGMSYFMQTDNQLTRSSILNKRLPNYDQYDALALGNETFQKYLVFEKYVLAKHVKTDGDYKLYKKIKLKIDNNQLNFKQKTLLKLPIFMLKSIQKIKGILSKKGIKVTSYSKIK